MVGAGNQTDEIAASNNQVTAIHLQRSNRMMPRESKLNLDALGIFASTLCLIHCLAFPLLAAAGAFFFAADSMFVAKTSAGSLCGVSPVDFWIHTGLLGAVAPFGVTAWGLGYRRHRDANILLLGMIGVGLLITALLFGHHLMDGQGEPLMTLAGSIAIVAAHLLNRRQCRCGRSLESRNQLALDPGC